MARRRNPEIATVPLTDPNEVANNAGTFIRTIGGTAQSTDVQTGRAGTAAFLRDVQTGGLSATNPAAFRAIQLFSADPKNKVGGQMLARQGNLEREQSRLQALLDGGVNKNGKPLTAAQIKRIQGNLDKTTKQLTTLTADITARQERVKEFEQRQVTGSPSAGDVMREADPDFYANVDRAQGIANTIGQITPEGQRFLDASGQGYQAGTIGAQSVTAAQMGQGMVLGGPSAYSPDQVRAINAARVADVRAREVGAGAVGDTLLGRALTMARSEGRLTSQDTRDAIQSARQGFAARGMATGNAALGAELLNRDRFARQRMFQDLDFARQVQTDDVDRQVRNAQNILTGDIANQSTAANLSIADQAAAMSAQRYNQIANQQANEYFQTEEGRRMMANQTDLTNRDSANMQQLNFINAGNADRALTADTANENARRLGTVTNNESLFNAAGYVDGQRTAGLGASLQMAGVQQAANPLFRALGSNPYAGGYGSQAVGAGAQLAGGVAQLNSEENTNNANATNWASYANTFQPSFNSSLTGSAAGDFALQTGVAGAKVAGEALIAKSDRRLKEDIRPVGKAGGVLGLTAYQYQYKDDPKNKQRVGFMAQDVKRVLPSAVREITVGGRKRLAIKPQAIGEAFARELMAQSR